MNITPELLEQCRRDFEEADRKFIEARDAYDLARKIWFERKDVLEKALWLQAEKSKSGDHD